MGATFWASSRPALSPGVAPARPQRCAGLLEQRVPPDVPQRQRACPSRCDPWSPVEPRTCALHGWVLRVQRTPSPEQPSAATRERAWAAHPGRRGGLTRCPLPLGASAGAPPAGSPSSPRRNFTPGTQRGSPNTARGPRFAGALGKVPGGLGTGAGRPPLLWRLVWLRRSGEGDVSAGPYVSRGPCCSGCAPAGGRGARAGRGGDSGCTFLRDSEPPLPGTQPATSHTLSARACPLPLPPPHGLERKSFEPRPGNSLLFCNSNNNKRNE